jgi:hypothetical protein
MFFIPWAEACDEEILSAPAANNTNRSEYAKCFLMMSETPLRGMVLNRKIKPTQWEKQKMETEEIETEKGRNGAKAGTASEDSDYCATPMR